MHQPHPDRAEDRLEGADKRGQRRRHHARARCEEGEADAEVDGPERKQQRGIGLSLSTTMLPA